MTHRIALALPPSTRKRLSPIRPATLIVSALLSLMAAPGAALAAQAGAPVQSPSKPEDLCTLSGKVTNAVTGEPIAKAEVTVDGRSAQAPTAGWYMVVTDARGEYEAKGIAPGQYRISAIRAGYSTDYRSPEGWNRQVPLTPGQNAADIDLKMTPQAVIAGQVVSSGGDGMPGYYVTPCNLRFSSEAGRQMMVETQGYTETDDRGAFRIYGLPPGTFYLYVYPSPPRTATGTELDHSAHPREEADVPSYYPGVTDQNGAAPIQLAAGQAVEGIVVKLVRARVTNVKGHVVDQTGMAGRRVRLALVPGAGPYPGSPTYATVGPQGEFEIREIPEGSYTVQPRAVAGMTQMTYGPQTFVVGQTPVENLDLYLPGPGEIIGRLTVEGDKPLDPRALRVGLQVPWSPDPNFRVTPAVPDEAGTFHLSSINPERYVFDVQNLPDGFYVKTARMGNVDAWEGGVDLTNGGGGSAEIVVSGTAAAVSGTVRSGDGNPVSGSTVALVPQETAKQRKPAFYRSAKTDAGGAFHFGSLPPGEYKLYAWQQVDDGAWVSGDFLRPFENHAAAITLRESDTQTVDLKIIPSER